jgi:hypothetical protein
VPSTGSAAADQGQAREVFLGPLDHLAGAVHGLHGSALRAPAWAV